METDGTTPMWGVITGFMVIFMVADAALNSSIEYDTYSEDENQRNNALVLVFGLHIVIQVRKPRRSCAAAPMRAATTGRGYRGRARRLLTACATVPARAPPPPRPSSLAFVRRPRRCPPSSSSFSSWARRTCSASAS